MKVRFVQSGGFAGLVKACELDTNSPGVGQELERLVRESGITGSVQNLSQTGRDLQQYEITIEEDGQILSATFDEATMPAAAKPLLAVLKRRARPTSVR